MVALSLNSASPPTLSVVIVNSDGLSDTLACLESIERNPPGCSFEMIVVDNCSREPSFGPIAARFPQARTLEAPRRQGFARNYNQGIGAARGEYVLILNNDTLVPAGALDALIAALRGDERYGVVGPRLVGRDGAIQHDCARDLPTPAGYLVAQLLLDPAYPPGRLWRRALAWQAARRRSGPVPCICGACMLVRRADLEAVGLLDEGFDFYYEDVEWCHRFQRRGRTVGYVAEAAITHLGDQSLGKVKVWAKQSEYRSALRYFTAYYGLSEGQRSLLWLATALNYFLRGFVMLLAEALLGWRSHARAYLYIWGWLLGERSAAKAGAPTSARRS
jgi:N-acetylglucosaminyl-diphospho-decaprenol L-rhamnosyltransferase